MSKSKEPNSEGLRAARRYAGWELGDPSWADIIIHAYLNPEAMHERLDEQDVPQQTGSYRSQW